jgi:hypothetical protein
MQAPAHEGSAGSARVPGALPESDCREGYATAALVERLKMRAKFERHSQSLAIKEA